MIWVHLFIAGLFFFLAILFFLGKGANLIAGYNTSSPQEKSKYDEKALCRFMGKLMLSLAGCFLLCGVAELFQTMALLWLGMALFLLLTVAGAIYANTGNRFRK